MPKRKAPMTVAQVAKLGPGNHRVGGVPGLVLQVNASGQGRSYTLRFTAPDGRRKEVGVGSAYILTLQQARDRALELQQALRLKGEDPILAKEQRRLEAQANVSFGEAVTGYLWAREGGWGNDKHQQQFVNTLDTYTMPMLGKLPVATLAPTHIAQCLAPIWTAKPETARRVRQRIEAVIAWADGHANRSRTNPAALAGLVQTGMLPKVKREVAHHAAMPWRDLPAFMARLRQADGVGAKALQFTILCAARSGEVRGATWSEIQGNTWVIPASRMKANREHRVPLTPAALALLGERGDDDALLFPGANGKPLSDMAMAMSLKRLKVEATAHGFRSSFRDWAGDTGRPRELAEMALAHAIGNEVENAYARSGLLDRRRELMADWAAFLA